MAIGRYQSASGKRDHVRHLQQKQIVMEPLSEALRLLSRQSQLEEAMRHPGEIRLNEEREIYELREMLSRYPAAVRTILGTSRRLHRPVETLSARDIDVGR
jgi:hypothetical protein